MFGRKKSRSHDEQSAQRGTPSDASARHTHELFGLDELEANSARRVSVGGHDVAIVRIDDDVYALGDTCSHAEVSLSGGWVDADECAIECAAHGALFDLNTGEPLSLPATEPVPVYEVAVVEGTVVLTITSGDGEGGGGS